MNARLELLGVRTGNVAETTSFKRRADRLQPGIASRNAATHWSQ